MPTRELEEDMMGWFSAIIERRPRRAWMLGAILLLGAALAASAALAMAVGTASGTTTGTNPCTNPASLAGSAFEIDANANLVVNTTNCIDWLTGGTNTSFRPGVLAKNDLESGGGDDSFGQGTAEDNPNPTITDGTIPPNKSDLKAFGVFTEDEFLELFWSRVQNPSGTTNMDFELNQKFCEADGTNCADNGADPPDLDKTPVRTLGDKLITYDLSKGGTVPTISIRTWEEVPAKGGKGGTTTQWGTAAKISGGQNAKALGSINTSLIEANQTGGVSGGLTTALGKQDPFTFGEAAISFDALFGTDACGQFGSAYLKSRSSDSFTAEIKDFVAPERVNISNCPSTLETNATGSTEIGGSISDTASLDVPPGTTGNIEFKAYGPDLTPDVTTDNCSGTPAFTNSQPVTGPGDYPSDPFKPTAAGTYYWTAEFKPDPDQNVDGTGVVGCNDPTEISVVARAPTTLSTEQEWLPNDTATNVNRPENTAVKFSLHKNGVETDRCSAASKVYPASGEEQALLDASGSAKTSNTTYKVSSVTSGDTYYWKVSIDEDASNTATTSCKEATTFTSLDNDTTTA